MLTSLTLQNFALIDHHELSFSEGFNVITGETGAGKSLVLDALSLCIGGRADTGMVRHGKNSADIYAQFELQTIAEQAIQDTSIKHNSSNTPVFNWFNTHEREFDGEILIRRQLSSNGRSKAWLNGAPVSIAELKELGAMLVNIHGQHAQQALLKPQFVVNWLDDMAGLQSIARSTATAYRHYQKLQRQADDIATKEAHRADRIELLQAQLNDINPLLEVDYAQIEAEHDELSNLEALMLEASQAVQLLDNEMDEPDIMNLLGKAIRISENQSEMSETFSKTSELLYLAQQHISEASALLADYAEQQLPDPERLAELDTLISLGHRLSRKHGLPAPDLIAEAQSWQDELDELLNQPTSETLQAQIEEAWQTYIAQAEVLSDKRQAVAPTIGTQLVAQLKPLALPNARCEFIFTERQPEQFNAQGIDDIELMFSANVGMPMQPLYKIASGGELSRMALVMQVLVATKPIVTGDDLDIADNEEAVVASQPMLVFDEVDVGISGGTAQVVGELLRQLGEHRQLLAITHQAQVASQSHQHILVQKHHDKEQTTSEIKVINGDEQVDELARMSGGVNITEVTREHARSLLADVANKG